MIRSPLLRFQLQESLGASFPEDAAGRLDALAAGNPGLLAALQAVDATYVRFGSLQQVAVEIGGLVVSEWDMSRGRIESGKSWKLLLGYGLNDIPDTVTAWRGLVHPEDLSALSAAIGEHVRDSSRKFSLDCRCRVRDGGWRWLRVSGRVVARDAGGEPARLVVVQQDVDAERQLQASLNAAREAAEAAGRSRTAFLANMSHEIRTPMNAILGMTELTLDTALDAEQRHYLGTVRSSCEALLSIVNDILDFSKIEAGKLQVEKIDFELSSVVFEAVRSLAVSAQQKGLDVVVDMDAELPPRIWGDPVRLRQVLTNLVGNAIKFTSEGSVTVVVRVQQAAPGSVTLLFEVRDTGVGIPPDKQQQIFQAFSQADVSTTRRFGGTGLGLAISARLVDLMGGSLSVSSEVGKGSVFGFALPFGIQRESAPVRRQPTGLAGQRVLLVGDGGPTMRLLESWFSRWGATPALQPTLAEARAAAEQWRGAGFPFPLVVLDASVALADGGASFSEWVGQPDAEPMVTLLTVAGQRDQLPQLKALGLTLYVVKPVAAEDLLDAVALATGQGSGDFRLDDFDVESSLHATEAASAKSLRILLVEDNPINQELAQRLLEKAGHQVTLAANGEEAVFCFEQQHFDVVLMDMQMPVMDGIEATQAIRARELRRSWVVSTEGFQQLPIIAMTANAMAGDRERCLQAGMNDYVSKPIRQSELFAALTRVTRGEAAPPSSGASDWAGSGAIDVDAAIRDLGDADLVREMASMLLAQWASHVDTIAGALAARDAPTLCRAAHTFKGLLAMFHAESARQHALALELAAKDARWEDAVRERTALGMALDLVKPEMEAFVGR